MTVLAEKGLVVRHWSQQEWLEREAAWTELLSRSTADPLFLSWEWLTLWWQLYGAARGNVLHVLVAERDGRLVGAAPLYSHQVRRGLVRTQSVQFVGVSWRDPTALVSQYVDVIATPEESAGVRQAFSRELLKDDSWGEFVIGQAAAENSWAEPLSQSAWAPSCYCRTIDHATSYQADLSPGFQAYLGTLGGSTRRSLWHLRRRLESQGTVQLEYVGAEDVEAGFGELNQLHQRRWHRPAFASSRLDFHARLAKRSALRGELAMTRLRVGERVVSLIYDLRRNARQYNLKMAFDPEFMTHGSLGLLHLGYAMESAADTGATVYDFLAGRGQNSDYKRNIGLTQIELISVQCVRQAPLRQLYRVYDRTWPKVLRRRRGLEQ